MNARSGSIFWAVALIAAGGIFLLQNLGILRGDVWGNLWPLFLILLGAMLLFGNFTRRGAMAATQSVPLEDAREAFVRVDHGAGQLRVDAQSTPGVLVDSSADDEFRFTTRRDGDRLNVHLTQAQNGWFWMNPGNWGRGFRWSVNLNRDVPLWLAFKSGASESIINLRDLQVREVSLETGASKTELTLPARGRSSARISAGAAEVRVHVPEGVAARISTSTGMASVNIDQSRFPSRGGVYESPDFENAENRAEIRIEGGVGNFIVH